MLLEPLLHASKVLPSLSPLSSLPSQHLLSYLLNGAFLDARAGRADPLCKWEYEGVLALVATLDTWLQDPRHLPFIPPEITNAKELVEKLSALILEEAGKLLIIIILETIYKKQRP